MSYIDKIDDEYPIRYTKKQKQQFQAFIKNEVKELPVCIIRSDNNENIIIGDIKAARIVIGAHYDTPMASLFPNIIFPTNTAAKIIYQLFTMLIMVAMAMFAGYGISTVLQAPYYIVVPIVFLVLSVVLYQLFPNEHNLNDNTSGVATILTLIKKTRNLNDVAFILFDNEEKGKKGSSSISKAYDVLNSKLVINLDCVGNGDEFIFVAKNNYDLSEYQTLKSLNNSMFHFITHKEGKVNSDYLSFKYGVSCVAVCSRYGIRYVPSIHTGADNYVSDNNIEKLSDFIDNFLKEINHGD